MRLGREIVDFIRLDLLDDADEVGRIGQVAVVEDQITIFNMRILIKMVDAVGIKERRAALEAVDDIAFFQQEFGKVSAVLSGDTGDECCFHNNSRLSFFKIKINSILKILFVTPVIHIDCVKNRSNLF